MSEQFRTYRFEPAYLSLERKAITHYRIVTGFGIDLEVVASNIGTETEARRIVACANACRGIPTEQLGKGETLLTMVRSGALMLLESAFSWLCTEDDYNLDDAINNLAALHARLRAQVGDTAEPGAHLDNWHCPHCGSEQITGGPVTVENAECWQEVGCNDCGEYWNEVYTFLLHETTEGEPIRERS